MITYSPTQNIRQITPDILKTQLFNLSLIDKNKPSFSYILSRYLNQPPDSLRIDLQAAFLQVQYNHNTIVHKVLHHR